MLDIRNLSAFYDDDGALRVLHNINITLKAGSCVAVLGMNGAGKSTLLKAISGVISRVRGTILFDNKTVLNRSEGTPFRSGTQLKPEAIVRLGVVQVPEGRQLFPNLTVTENLRLGGYVLSNGKLVNDQIDKLNTHFPILKKKKKDLAGNLSGGEQQMLAIARALISSPRLIMLDEPSMGLAPKIVESTFRILKDICKDLNSTILIVEQNIPATLKIADYAYVLGNGSVVKEASASEITQANDLQEIYFGYETQNI